MKAQFLGLSAAALLLAGSANAASAAGPAPTEFAQFSSLAQARADRLLAAAGVDSTAQPVSVRASVAVDGHLTGITVLKSSGSPDTDRAVATVLRRVLLSDPPLGLLNGAVILNVGKPAIEQAEAY